MVQDYDTGGTFRSLGTRTDTGTLFGRTMGLVAVTVGLFTLGYGLARFTVEYFRELVESVPANRFAIVTSGSRALAVARLQAVGIPVPDVLVTAEQVERGKPDPAGYLHAARLLGVDPADAVVLEDAPPGVEAGRAAGMTVVAVLTTSDESSLRDAHSRVPDLRSLLPVRWRGVMQPAPC